MKLRAMFLSMLLLSSLLLASAASAQDEPLKVFAAYATPIEEPWDGVIHAALQAAADEGRIIYTYQDEIGYSGDMEIVLREVAEDEAPDIIFGDAFGNEQAVRRVARDYPEIAFVQGVAETNPKATVLVTFINSWFDPAAAQEAALAQVDAGADILFAERFGPIDVAAEKGLLAFGNMSDQNALAPETVVTGPVWDMGPTVNFVIDQVRAGSYTALDLKDFSMMAYGGASLAPLHDFADILDPALIEMVSAREQEIIDGLFRVNIDEDVPAGAVVPGDVVIGG
jgi:basic membrane lipoprotein Med (substrate-binding protein (PBP1-ABC) superfamily)